jgi:hypothetical protein
MRGCLAQEVPVKDSGLGEGGGSRPNFPGSSLQSGETETQRPHCGWRLSQESTWAACGMQAGSPSERCPACAWLPCT